MSSNVEFRSGVARSFAETKSLRAAVEDKVKYLDGLRAKPTELRRQPNHPPPSELKPADAEGILRFHAGSIRVENDFADGSFYMAVGLATDNVSTSQVEKALKMLVGADVRIVVSPEFEITADQGRSSQAYLASQRLPQVASSQVWERYNPSGAAVVVTFQPTVSTSERTRILNKLNSERTKQRLSAPFVAHHGVAIETPRDILGKA